VRERLLGCRLLGCRDLGRRDLGRRGKEEGIFYPYFMPTAQS